MKSCIQGGVQPDALAEVDVTITSNEECAENYGDAIERFGL